MSWLVHLVMTLVVSVGWRWGGPPADGVVQAEPPIAVARALPSTSTPTPTPTRAQPSSPSKAAATRPRPPLVVVRALGLVPPEQLRGVCRLLLAEHPVRCAVRASRSVTEVLEAWDVERRQLDARRALDLLFETRSRDAVVELDVTAIDLFEDGKPYVFGLASLPDRTALLSLARLHSDDPETRRARLRTLVRHEFGHAVGLTHHDVTHCVMRQDPTVATLDEAPEGPCVACRATVHRQLERLERPGQTALDRARGLLVRERREEARRILVDALWAYRPDLALLDDFARLFYEAGQYNEAISLLRHSLDREPGRPATYVQLGLAYQQRAREGDLVLAVGLFEQALELRPDWESVSDHLEATREVLRAQGPRARP